MSKRIIVPTDFSKNAYTAAKYACEIALEHGYHIHLFHCYNSKTSVFDEKINAKETTNSVLRGDLIMNELEYSLKQMFPTISLDTECREGLIIDILPKIAIEPNFSLIILGSNGLEDGDSKLFGSTANQIASESHIPVIVVPSDIKNIKISKTAILTNFKDDELETLEEFINLLNMPTSLDIIHVYQNSDDLSLVEKSISNWANEIQKITTNTQIETILRPIDYSNTKEDTIAEVINTTIKENNYDIVIVTKSRKSFFDKWFSRSISKEVILELESIVFFDNN